MARLRSLLSSRWFKLLLSAVLLALLLFKTDRRAMRAAIGAADLGWLAAAWALLVISQLASAYRWALLARAVGFDVPLRRYYLYYFSGMYVNLFGPGTVVGDVGRAVFLAGGRRRALALTTVAAHRATGLVAIVWITAAACVLLPDAPLPWILRVVAALTIPATITLWLLGPRTAARMLPRENRWRLLVERDLAPYWDDRRLLARAVAWAVAMHGFQIVAGLAVARSLALTLPWTFFLVVVPLMNMLSTLPFSLQGIGVREAGYWSYLASIGLPRELGLAMGLLTSAVVIAANLSGLPAFLLLRGDTPPPDAAADLAAPPPRGDRR